MEDHNLNNADIELQVLLICKPFMKRVIFINVYRPPDGKPDIFIQHLKNTLSSIQNLSKFEVILTGDMNIDKLTKVKLYENLCETLAPFKLRQLINEVTRISPNPQQKDSILDLMFTNIDIQCSPPLL